MLEVNRIYNEDCLEGLKKLDDESVDLTVTSPPYDDLRTYGGTLVWGFDIFKEVAKELYRVTRPGGIVVWVVNDSTNKTETGNSFRQALYFKDECGFLLHDTMIYEKNGSSRPARKNSKRYTQIFEYMFVFSKGEIRQDITLIADKRNKWAGWAKWGRNTTFNVNGDLVESKKNQPVISEFSLRNNIWKYSVSFNDKTGHPAVFPERLAQDNILSWSVEGDLVLDPFMGSGTTAKMAILNKRNYIGFEKNKDYYEKSLERIAKYVGQTNNSVSIEKIDFLNGGDEEEDDDELEVVKSDSQVSTEEDKEIAGKRKLWDKYVQELEQYFNEQTLGTLKTLKFSFVTKTNEERVKRLRETQEQVICEEPKDTEPKEVVSEKTSDCEPTPNIDENLIRQMVFDTVSEIIKSDAVKEYILELCSENFEPKRIAEVLPSHCVENEPTETTSYDVEVPEPQKTTAKIRKKYTHSNGTLVKVFGDEPYFGTIISSELVEGENIYTIQKKDDNDLVKLTAKQFKGIRKKILE